MLSTDDAVDALRAHAYNNGKALSTADLHAALNASGGDLDAASAYCGLPKRTTRFSVIAAAGATLSMTPKPSPISMFAVTPRQVEAIDKLSPLPQRAFANLKGLKDVEPMQLMAGQPALSELSEPAKAPSASMQAGSLCVVGAVTAAAVVVHAMVTLQSPASGHVGADPAIDTGDTAWMMVSTMAVLLMIPGLGLFEAGLLRAKNSVSVLMQCFAGLALLSVLWFLVGFSLCFSPTDHGLVGGLEHVGLAGVGWKSPFAAAPTIPGVLFVAFQGMFAAITPLLCTGAFAERLKFEAFVAFILAWSVVVYYPLCHWVWGGGWLAQLGVVDFAGGIVIHTSAGVASLVSAIMLGPRHDFGSTGSSSALAPHNLPMAATGAGLLWFGWFAFNGGSSLGAGPLAASTLMTTHIAGSTGAVAWLVLDWCRVGRPTFVGAINGAIAGLAGVTPASGFITPASGFVVGLLCGVGSYGGVLLFKEKLGVDDALDVSSVHGLTGVLGSLLLGVYATSDVNPDGPDGMLSHATHSLVQLEAQVFGVVVAAVWAAAGTWLVMAAVEKVFKGARANRDVESRGLDRSQHGEMSYQDLTVLM